MRIKSICVVVGVIMLSMAASTWADDGKGVTKLTNNQHLYGQLGGNFWEWSYATEFALGVAEGEVDCTIGQSDRVWFLPGTFGGIAERSCTILRKKSLFIPLVNTLIFYEAGVDPIEFDLSIDEKRIWLDGLVGGGSLSDNEAVRALADLTGVQSGVACNLYAVLDGEPLVFTTPIVRGQSGPVTITTDNQAIADGYYALLPPLDLGLHQLSFGGGICLATDGTIIFDTTVIYDLNVVKE